MSTLKLAFIGLGARIVMTLVALLNALVLARWLEPAGYGTYVVFMKTVSILTMVGDLGQAQTATAFFGPYERQGLRLLSTFLRVIAAASLATAALAGVVLWLAGDILLPGIPRGWLPLICGLIPLTVYANFWYGMMIGRGEIWRLNAVRMVSSVLSLLATIVLVVAFSGGATAAMAGYAVVVVIQVLLMSVVQRPVLRASDAADLPARLPREVVSFGLKGYPSVVCFTFWTAVPVYVLNSMYGPASAGVFAIAQQVVERVLLPVVAMQEALYRKLAGLGTAAQAAAAMNRYLGAAVGGMAVVAVAGYPVLVWGVPRLLGAEYFAAGELTGLLLLGAPLMTIVMVLDPYFIAFLRRPGLASLLAGANVALVAVLALTLTPGWSARGATAAQVLSQLGAAALALAFYLRLSGSGWREVLFAGPAELVRSIPRSGPSPWWRRSRV